MQATLDISGAPTVHASAGRVSIRVELWLGPIGWTAVYASDGDVVWANDRTAQMLQDAAADDAYALECVLRERVRAFLAAPPAERTASMGWIDQ